MDKDIFSLANKTILILGASSGIGRCVAKICSDFGATVILHGRNRNRLQETLDQLSNSGHMLFDKDINDIDFESKLTDLVQNIQLQGIFFAVGIHKFTPIRTIKIELVNEIIDSNFISAVKIIKFIGKIANENNPLSAIFMSSVASISSEIGINVYSASKAALNTLIKSSAKELIMKSVRLNTISAGFVNTEMFEGILKNFTEEQSKVLLSKHSLGVGTPEDIAYLTLYLLSDASRWITGTNIVVDGGATL
jgi:NAD(P)-dependent dehydrogenase (short-subunit alcohol dehydrogenase family)